VSVHVRPAAPTDHEAAIAVWAASDTARRGAPSPPEVPQMLRERFARDDVWVLVADDAGVVVGVAQGAPAREDGGTGPVLPGRCHLSMVFVAPDRWGEGIGSVLVDAGMALAAGLGYDTVQLYTHEDNDRAQRLYAGKGFVRDGDVRADAWGDLVGRWARRLVDAPL
jgi:ribosomal protein S18 acetylase RimI-like enzyme